MPSVAEYRQYAAECLMWARQAKTDFERELFLKMAHDRLHAANPFRGTFPPRSLLRIQTWHRWHRLLRFHRRSELPRSAEMFHFLDDGGDFVI